MKAITLTQPWSTLVSVGAKLIETRSWRTDYRGPLAIHAAAGLGPVGGIKGLYETCAQPEFFRALEPHYPVVHLNLDTIGLIDCIQANQLPRGAIVAVCWLSECMPTNDLSSTAQVFARSTGADKHPQFWDLTGQERAFGDYTPGRFAWLLCDICALPTPIPARGALGLWEWEGSI